ncbi:MAG: thioredoxin domain-containing protein [Chlamydiales bacterium]
MANEIKPPRLLVWITIGVLIFLSAIVIYICQNQPHDSFLLNIEGQPTLGSREAKVQVVVFEEPRCINCKEFNRKIYPKIKAEFIDTDKVSYTVIPVSFLPHSMPAAVALMCVYHRNSGEADSQSFIKYLDYLIEHQNQEITTESLTLFAKEALGNIRTDFLKKCINDNTYRNRIEQNTAYGRKLMGGVIATPTIFVNGEEPKYLSFEEISFLINQAMENQEETSA